MPAWVRWILSALGAAAVTGGLFVAMPHLMRLDTTEAGLELIAWQEANPPEYGGVFVWEVPVFTIERVRNEDDRFSEDSNAFGFSYIVYESGMTRPDGPISRFADLPAWDGTTISGSVPDIQADISSLPITFDGHSYPADPCFWPLEYPTQFGFRKEGEVRIVYDLNGEGEMINPRVVWYSHVAYLRAVERVLARCSTDDEVSETGLEMTLRFELED